MLVGRDFWDVLTESTRDLMREMVESRPDEPYEAVMVREDGTSFPAEIEEKEVEVTDRPVRVAAIRDVTERKKREAEILLAKEEAEQMARLKSSLLNNMSHELRTPITSIIGYAELIMNEPEGPHEDFAARIRQSGKRLSRTLRAVLEMAQIESGTLEVQPREVGILSLMRDVVREYRPMAAEEDLALEVRERIDDATLYTDRTLVYRAVGNIVHNAIKFSEEGPIRIDTDATDAGVRIAVSDSGIGIDPDFRPHLFEPFKQESEGRARTHEGTGLGLALTKRMVDLLGGTIEVESVKGEGSTFVVELPPVMPTEEHEAAVMERDAS
jgi:signal transduction histidine kinase